MSKAAELAALIGSQTALSNRNLVINGAMQVWQRGTSIDTLANGSYLCDRWRIAHSGTDGNVDVDRSTDVPAGKGFGFSQKISMDASESSLDANDLLRMHQRFEGQNLQSLKKGTSSAESITISFYVKSSVASPNYSLVVRDEDNDRNNALSYTVDSANTWEFKSLTFSGDTTGALDNDNARSFDIDFIIDGGTNRTSGTYFNGTWAAGDNTRTLNATTGWLVSSNPTWFITGVQMELGEQATPFEHRSYADELQRCQRYYQVPTNNAMYAGTSNGSTQIANIGVPLITTLRADPTSGTLSSGPTGWHGNNNGATGSTNAPTLALSTQTHSTTLKMTVGGFSGLTDNRVATITVSGLTLDAEL